MVLRTLFLRISKPVFSEEASPYPRVSRIVKFRSDVVRPVNPLGCSKRRLYLVPFT
mgnify:CR=1